MTHPRLTFLVPTHNRPHFLRRFLHFYTQFPPGFPFLVVDSSNQSAAAENLAAIESVRERLDIDYLHADMNFTDKCVKGLERVCSPFVALCADDDLVFPDTVARCVEFLANESGYASARGRNAILDISNRRRWCMVLKGYSLEDDLPFDRCRRMARQWFSNFFAVHRTETLLDIFQITAANTDSGLGYRFPETLLSQLSVLRGRVKVLPLMYALKEQHGANTSIAMRNQRQSQSELLYERFRECLADQFERAGIDRADAERFIEDSYGFLRDPNLTNRGRPKSTIVVLRQFLHGIANRAADYFWTDRTRHRRLLRAGDLAGCEVIWHAAVQLIRDFPHGIPSDHSGLKRCG